MARQPSMTGRVSDADAGMPQAGQNDLAPIVEALTQATQALVSTTNQLMQFAQGFAGPAPSRRRGRRRSGHRVSRLRRRSTSGKMTPSAKRSRPRTRATRRRSRLTFL
jgi:hypothetical protein